MPGGWWAVTSGLLVKLWWLMQTANMNFEPFWCSTAHVLAGCHPPTSPKWLGHLSTPRKLILKQSPVTCNWLRHLSKPKDSFLGFDINVMAEVLSEDNVNENVWNHMASGKKLSSHSPPGGRRLRLPRALEAQWSLHCPSVLLWAFPVSGFYILLVHIHCIEWHVKYTLKYFMH